ncbi:MAG: hypothetical protein IIX70_03965 [Oscillospiraceae bacterium]|nr:hypothetical protein [Oscillospiraceae bacterium]
MKNIKKIVALVLAMVLVAGLSVAGTVAYLTDRDAKTNVFTVGNVDISLNEAFGQGAALVPGVEINKVPTITNNGPTDAWVWMTFSIPSALDNFVQGTEQGSSENIIHWNPLGATAEGYVNQDRVEKAIQQGLLPEGTTADDIIAANKTWNVFNSLGQGQNVYQETIDNVSYNTYVLLYNKALTKGETTLPSLFKVYLDAQIDIDPEGEMYRVVDGNATKVNWNIKTNGNPLIHIAAYGIQKDNFATVNDAYAAYNTQWGSNGRAEADAPVTTNPEDDTELENALKDPNAKQIVVNLTGDVTYDVAAWANEAMGGEETDYIMINGNGHTITFNQQDSDWNNIVTNGAKLIISNAKITNSGHNDGPWNRHDLNFACEVELNNVVSDKALALKAGATLNNVTINDANNSDTYAIWIQPNGQTVTLNGCTIDMLACTDGRGIKIDEQYVSDPAKVTLNVTDTTFKTEEKSAILVKSAAGADVNLSNVNIAEVAADSTYPVWVDEASASYADLVVVTGGSKIVES